MRPGRREQIKVDIRYADDNMSPHRPTDYRPDALTGPGRRKEGDTGRAAGAEEKAQGGNPDHRPEGSAVNDSERGGA